ncbi:MAG: polysaccharide deacetylase family protein [Bacteroidales bacterium]|nr:polysaccharide deacetylase family protein [Bacteroidales bacterium]
MISLRRKTYNLFHPKIGEIWCLHRVLPERSALAGNRELEITPDYLESMIERKRRQGFEFVDLDTIVAAANGSETPEKQLVNISFDDGFEDVYTNAYPVLKRHHIPFTLYVTTDMPDGKADLWWLQLERMAGGDAEWFNRVSQQVYVSQGDFGLAMHTLTSSQADHSLCRQSLTWDQIHSMVSEGWCTVGSHGVSHTALSLLPEKLALRELIASKHRLEAMLGVEVRHFSYPHSFYSKASNQLVFRAGYHTAVIAYGGSVRRRTRNAAFLSRKNIIQP